MKNFKNCHGISLIILVIIVAVIICGVILIFNKTNNDSGNSSNSNNSSQLNTVITADNYNTIGNIFNENQDELYYFTYACLYYSFTERLTTGQDENTAMQKIYGKTVQQLVNEGKELMKKDNITVEEYKKKLNNQ
ncbi:MAG: hypothetical protein HFJ29_00845 [Clostridia bacterium]|nr:hypothetical protein [Clostridia bacterium]